MFSRKNKDFTKKKRPSVLKIEILIVKIDN